MFQEVKSPPLFLYMDSQQVKNQLIKFGSSSKAAHSVRFFKTGKGEYGEGDIFIGCTVPESRSVASKFKELPLAEIEKLLHDEMHECRFCALVILTDQFKKANELQKEEILIFYLNNTKWVNNWDLVDVSSYKIVGEWLKDKSDRGLLYRLANSELLWDQRIAIVSTMTLIKNDDFDDILKLSKFFLNHKHDLIHKACGWMLREVGKRDEYILKQFLNNFATLMPRTMLRYSIEKLSAEERKEYMNK